MTLWDSRKPRLQRKTSKILNISFSVALAFLGKSAGLHRFCPRYGMPVDYSSVRTTAGDLNGGDLATVMEAEKNLQQMASASLAIIGQRRALVLLIEFAFPTPKAGFRAGCSTVA